MSLKAFHVFFITVAVLLCVVFGVWCVSSDYTHGRVGYTITGWASFGLGILLVVYEILFLNKMKETK
jgi:4-amino-4-deoxy-L-arabinose transferase-like glycosyltransferase